MVSFAHLFCIVAGSLFVVVRLFEVSDSIESITSGVSCYDIYTQDLSVHSNEIFKFFCIIL